MALATATIVNALTSHASTLGVFDAVNGHEPKNAPGGHLSCAIWVQEYSPASSGLNVTSMRLEFSVRIFTSMLMEPPDAIDPAILDAVDLLLADYIGNFTLGGLLRNVDIRGIDGEPLRVQAGYLDIGGKHFRVMTITLPLVLNDLYSEAP